LKQPKGLAMIANRPINVFALCGVFLTLCGCASNLPNGSEPPLTEAMAHVSAPYVHEWTTEIAGDIDQEDHLVLETVLTDLLTYEEFDPLGAGESHIVLDVKTAADSFYLSQNQIASELRGERRVSDSLGPALSNRNTGSVSLAQFKPANPSILVHDVSNEEKQFTQAFWKAYPQAKGFVTAWLPVYSKDGKAAVLRFWFGPTAHSATGTYLLVKEQGKWKVAWRSLAYYA
jgi:hypothetical protein